GRCVVTGVFARTGRIGQDGGTQHVVRVQVGATHTFVDHVRNTHGGVRPLYVHTDLDKHGHNTGVLADRAMAFGTHTRVDQNLRHGVLGSLGFFTLVGLIHGLDKVQRMVVGNVLQGVSNALYKIVLLDYCHVLASRFTAGWVGRHNTA